VRRVHRELRARVATWALRACLGHREPRASREPPVHRGLSEHQDFLEILVRPDSLEIVDRSAIPVRPDQLEHLVLRAVKVSRVRRVQPEVWDSPERLETRVPVVTRDTPELPDILDKLDNSVRRDHRDPRVCRVSSVLPAASVRLV